MNNLFVLDRRKISNLIFIVVFLLPIIKYYDIPGTSIGSETFLLIILFGLFILLYHVSKNIPEYSRNLNKSRNWFFAFAVWAVVITVFYEMCTNISMSNSYSTNSLFNFIVALISLCIIYMMLSTKLDICKAVKIYSYFVYMIIVIYIFQWILMIAGIRLDWSLPFHNYNSSYSYLNSNVFGMNSSPTAIFSERAHLCEYLVPFIALCLYSDRFIEKWRIPKAIMVTLVVLSTVSGNGFVVVAIEWFLYFMMFGAIPKHKKIPIAAAGLLILIVAFEYISSIPKYSLMFSQLFTNTAGGSYVKANYRVYRGFDYFAQMPLIQKIFGVGMSHMSIFAKVNGLSSIYDVSHEAFEFFSTITQVLLYFGIVGLYLYAKHLISLATKSSSFVKGMLIVVIALWFASQMLFANTHIMYILIITVGVIESDSDLRSPLMGDKNEKII